MANTVGEIISRIRKQIKDPAGDGFVTDRFIYSLLSKHISFYLKREDRTNKLLRFDSAFESLDFVKLIEVDTVEASCTGIKSGITIKRTEDKLDMFFKGYYGSLIRNVTSLDGSERVDKTSPVAYTKIANSKNHKYNPSKYYWRLNGYLYFPDVEWDAVKIDGMVSGDISAYKCADCSADPCSKAQDAPLNVPDYLLSEIETRILREDFGYMFEVPSDPVIDKQSPLR